MADRDDDFRDPAEEPPLFADEESAPERTPRHRRPVFMTVAVTAVAALGIAAWYGLSGPGGMGSDGNVPVVRADPEPVKVHPDDPGGMDVPDQDKLVYDRLEGEADRPQVEHLLPPPEAPLDPPVAAELAPNAPPPPPPAMVPAPIAGQTPIPPASAPAAPAAVPPPPAAPEAAAAAPSPPPPPSSLAAVATATAGGFKVQLASVRSMEAAQAEWARLSKRNADVLGDLDLDVERADLGQRGVFFRIRGGPIASEDAAKAICETMKSRDVGCLVVSP